MQKYAVLNSGFISSNNELLTINPIHNHKFTELLLNKAHLNTQNTFFYNKDIAELFRLWAADKKHIKNEEYRERVIILAYKLFQHKSLYGWMLDQITVLNKTLNQTHIEFLLETVNFIFGIERKLTVVQWARLLLVNNDVFNYKDDFIRNFTRDIKRLQGSDLTNTLQLWLSNPNGLEDLMISMYVIFGDRKYITEIVDV